MGKIYTGQIGVMVEIEIETANTSNFNWSAVTSHEIVCLLPDSNIKTFQTTRDDNKLYFITTSATDFPVSGRYVAQPRLVGNTFDLLGNSVSFVVHDKFR